MVILDFLGEVIVKYPYLLIGMILTMVFVVPVISLMMGYSYRRNNTMLIAIVIVTSVFLVTSTAFFPSDDTLTEIKFPVDEIKQGEESRCKTTYDRGSEVYLEQIYGHNGRCEIYEIDFGFEVKCQEGIC